MAAPTNVVTSATPNVGVREDLEDVIYRVAPEETPFVSNIGSGGKATEHPTRVADGNAGLPIGHERPAGRR
jgi:hypothetical protein